MQGEDANDPLAPLTVMNQKSTAIKEYIKFDFMQVVSGISHIIVRGESKDTS